jgi:hypothetical protein
VEELFLHVESAQRVVMRPRIVRELHRRPRPNILRDTQCIRVEPRAENQLLNQMGARFVIELGARGRFLVNQP